MRAMFPSLLTMGNAFLGFLSIYFSLFGQLGYAGLCVFYATVFDLFDGRVARLLNVANNFGKELDSFSDFLSFGVAPAMMVIASNQDFFDTHNIPQIFLFVIAFVYLLAVASRLALFNNPEGTYVSKAKKYRNSDFIGTPSPFGGGIMALIMGFSAFSNGVWGNAIPLYPLPDYIFLFISLFMSLALLIPVPYPKLGLVFFAFKQYPVTNWIIIICLIMFCRWTLLVMSIAYLILPLVFFVLKPPKR